ncbi:MAG: HEAT repeat domain-containing protein, partial [Thermoplasmata archaeon]|nr:HEAT repeat domain-containing protein [Thermoplasmata archaeon]
MEQNVKIFMNKIEKKTNSPDTVKRKKCVREIVKHMALDDAYIVGCTEYLVKLLKDDDPDVRMEALKATETIVATVLEKIEKNKQFMVDYGGKKVPLRKLFFYQAIQMTRDPDPEIRLAAVTITGKKSLEYPLIRRKATPFLVARIRDKEKEVRNQAIYFIIKISYHTPEITSPFLKRLFTGRRRSTDIYVAYVLDRVMTKQPLPEFIPILFEKLSDADSATEKYVISALVKCGIGNIDDIREYLVQGLTDQSYALWWIKARNMLIILRQVAEKRPDLTRPYLRYVLPLMVDDNWGLRMEAAHTVGMMGAEDPNRIKEALPFLVDLTKDPHEMVEEIAISALTNLGIREADYSGIRDAARILMQSKAKIVEIKRHEDLNEKIREAYLKANKAFAKGEYERSL